MNKKLEYQNSQVIDVEAKERLSVMQQVQKFLREGWVGHWTFGVFMLAVVVYQGLKLAGIIEG